VCGGGPGAAGLRAVEGEGPGGLGPGCNQEH